MELSDRVIKAFVYGMPRAKQSFMVVGHGKGIAPKATKDWQEAVHFAVKSRCIKQKHQPNPKEWYEVKLVFVLAGRVNPDIDNLTKGVLDACNGIIWIDDRQVQSLSASKVNIPMSRKNEAGVYIEARPVGRLDKSMLDAEFGDFASFAAKDYVTEDHGM